MQDTKIFGVENNELAEKWENSSKHSFTGKPSDLRTRTTGQQGSFPLSVFMLLTSEVLQPLRSVAFLSYYVVLHFLTIMLLLCGKSEFSESFNDT
jgi:hypothetical protein